MAAPILSQEVAEHLEVAIHLSNRRLHLRFLHEAEALVASNLTAAVRVAGVVLESIREEWESENGKRLEKWFELRDCVAHAQVPAPTLDQAREMIGDLRRSLMREIKVGPHVATSERRAEAARQVRGKYKFVPTSTAEFIRRKPEELQLEDDEHGA